MTKVGGYAATRSDQDQLINSEEWKSHTFSAVERS